MKGYAWYDASDAKTDALGGFAWQTWATLNAILLPIHPPWYHPGTFRRIDVLGKTVLGYFGEIHPRILPAFEYGILAAFSSFAAFEIFLDAIPAASAPKAKAKPPLKLSDFQAVERDFAFIVDAKVSCCRHFIRYRCAGDSKKQC